MSTVACPLCSQPVELEAGTPGGRCAACQALVFAAPGGPTVLVAHESDEICLQMGHVLVEAGFHAVRGAHGGHVMQLLRQGPPPAAVVLDVGLDEVTTFQIIEYLHNTPELQPVKVVLVASVFSKTAYKRRPSTLYGADDYVEQHHIPDKLAQKVANLLGITQIPLVHSVGERRAVIQAAEPRHDLSGIVRVRALAHSIVADIALYHQAEFEHVVRGEGATRLEDPLNEGRRLLAEMVNPSDYDTQDPIGEAFNAFVDEMRRVTR